MTDFGIVVGINKYPGLGDLNGPCADAKAFYDWLVDPDKGGLETANVRRLLSEDFAEPDDVEDARPTVVDILNLFRPIIQKVGRGDHEDGRLFVFVAGHGFADTQRQFDAALYAANAENELPQHIAVSRCVDWLRRNWAFDEIILIMDCCRTTNPTHEVVDPQFGRTNGNRRANKVKRFHGFATGWGQQSREKTFDGTVRGIFTVALMDALEHATPNRNGRVTGTIVEDYIHNVIYSHAGDVEIDPPEINAPKRNNVCFLMRKKAQVDTNFITDAQNIGSELVIFGHDLREVERIAITSTNFSLELDPGMFYTCSIVGQSELKSFQVPSEEQITI